MTKYLRWILIGAFGLLLLLAGGFVAYAQIQSAEPTAEALAALESNEFVTVEQDEWLVFRPLPAEPTVGFIFYPGGFVDPAAYAPAMQDIAAAGYLAVIVPMPLNLAVLGAGRAADVVEAFPGITEWAIGGHSLGGSMAAQFVLDEPDRIDGLALWAAYPAGSTDLSTAAIWATSIYGTQDGLVSEAELIASKSLLPPETAFVAIEGGNHAQFGSYGPQNGDLPASISPEEQREQTVAATLDLLEQLPAE